MKLRELKAVLAALPHEADDFDVRLSYDGAIRERVQKVCVAWKENDALDEVPVVSVGL